MGMHRDDDDDEADEEVGSASSAAGRTLGVGPPNTSIRLALRTNDDNLSTIVVLDADDDVSNGGGEWSDKPLRTRSTITQHKLNIYF